jgi:hypothetical protein
MKSIARCLLLAALLLPTMPVRAHDADAQMAEFANAFLGSLKEEQRAKAVFKFEDEERENWHFIPRERKGLPMKEMTATSSASWPTPLMAILASAIAA